jgi:succinate-semialdehyde dehydrogenase / glutarate-semialdehyde dehydrogenase
MLTSHNPYIQIVQGEYPEHTIEEIHSFLAASVEVFFEWSHMSFSQRTQYISSVAELMKSRREELARISTEEMGMLFIDALSDIDKTIANIQYFAQEAEWLLASEKHDKWEIIYQPLGTILVIAPWNFPYNQGLRNVIPQLMAGNAVMLKHASNLPRTSLALQRLFDDARIPKWVFQSLLIQWKDMETLISDTRIQGVSITAGDVAGRAVGELAGKYLKPTVLELWGNDACIVLPDATAEETVSIVTKWRMANGGQKCNAIKRLVIVWERPDLVQALVVSFESFTLGDPMHPDTTLPPLVNAQSVAEIAHAVEDALAQGAKLITGWEMMTLWDVSKPQFYLPTILANVSKENIAYDTEFFWPVLVVHTVNTVEEAIALANDSQYWLGCVVIGHDEKVLNQCAHKVHVWNIAFNNPVTSYPFLPYGGIKNSGYGRELWEAGIKAFMNVKTIVR